MKNRFSSVVMSVVLLLIFFIFSGLSFPQSKKTEKIPVKLMKVTLHVTGMTWPGCVPEVRGALKRLPGVTKVDVSFIKKRAVVVYDSTKVSVLDMKKALKRIGYGVKGKPVPKQYETTKKKTNKKAKSESKKKVEIKLKKKNKK